VSAPAPRVQPPRRGPLVWVLVAVAGTELCALAFLALVWQPAVLGMFADFGGRLPAVTRLVLERWFMAAAAAVVAGGAGAALAVRRPALLLAVACAAGAVVIALVIYGSYAPIWQLADAVRGP
jgi:hypothetical protein